MHIRKEIRLSGIVQGVGFRPYVYRLATDRSLEGNVTNTPAGLTIEIQGPPELVDDFVARLPEEAPALAQITRVSIRELPCKPSDHFEILASHTSERVSALISPDVAVCSDCLREMFDPRDRRYLYPFINCTNCGPRFTIVRNIPYDRARTTMSAFLMCDECRAEYHDLQNRRFHAQPNACWQCGPQLAFWDAQGHSIKSLDPIEATVECLRSGQVVAIKGLGGFHLAVDATNSAAIVRLRERKRRIEKPFAVMVPDLKTAARCCEVDSKGQQLLSNWQRPIVLLPRIKDSAIAKPIAPNQRNLGVFLPYTPMHHLLFTAGKFEALVMTSGNLSEEPIAIDNREAVERLAGVADFFLVHNREILLGCDDSVVRPSARGLRQIRRSRGYVPAAVALHKEIPQILAVGGELKNTICLTRDKLAFLSQYIGDLENLESFDFFRRTIERLSRILAINPEVIAHDLHPDYHSTKWALAQTGLRHVAVQHHHAHIAACMAENQIDGKVIGIALDGAGYGNDGHIWGGEALIADYAGFERAGYFEYVPMPGGSAAIREPWRMGLSYLYHAFGEDVLELDIPFVQGLDPGKAETILGMIDRRVNSPLTSSCGRLFDAVAAVAGIRNRTSYEAQAAMEVEFAGQLSRDSGAYRFTIEHREGCWRISVRSLFEEIVEDLRRNTPVEAICRRFQNGLVEILIRAVEHLREQTGLQRVCLSGGTFHNSYLLENLVQELETESIEVFTHAQVPAGDGGLSLGQALVAAHSK